MASKLIKWQVSPAPTGRYRSFETRAWPQAVTKTEREYLMFAFLCNDEYSPSVVKSGNHAPLKALVYDYRQGAQNRKMHKSKESFKTLAEAKAWCEKFITEHPDFLPE